MGDGIIKTSEGIQWNEAEMKRNKTWDKQKELGMQVWTPKL